MVTTFILNKKHNKDSLPTAMLYLFCIIKLINFFSS